MKINKKYMAALEWGLAILLIIICFNQFKVYYGYFSPTKAIKAEERRAHYGPSEIVKTMDFKGNKIYFLKYKDWFSVDVVEKRGLKWYTFGAGGSEIENQYRTQISYGWDEFIINKNQFYMNFYGYVSDLNIEKVVLESRNKENSVSSDVDDTRMFALVYERDWHKDKENMLNILKGFDKDGNLIYEHEIFTWD